MYHDPTSKQPALPSIHTPAIQRQSQSTPTAAAPASRQLLQLSAQLGNQQFGKWLASQGSSTTSQARPVIQRTVQLNAATVNSMENAIDIALDAMNERDDTDPTEYVNLYNLYNNFGTGSLTMETIEEIRTLTRNSASAVLRELDRHMEGLITGNVRNSNYPSSYSQQAKDALTTYKTNHQNPLNTSQCLCPHCNTQVAKTSMTIDHITPVATHWNTTGYNTDRDTRNEWYSDTTNHRYLCGPCNSSIGSGGVRYNLFTGPNYRG
ncbi:HNH endonuclease signature motif containing protein [Paenibacillus campi]|uniref:HNH endonuclease n=1 Tax=Paenibacillus campi TaxID=3106031 RepID=UPI002AFF8129|nr:HNH endonuclease signature motif containing protein [Paenibacillus sp. SGZ-1009]